jgi:hypothetical protein
LRVSTDEQHVALPALYGAPAYARPPAAAPAKVRPFDPDELPLEAHQTDEEREFTATLPARAYAPGGVQLDGPSTPGSAGTDSLGARSLSLRAIAGRFLRS